MTSVSNTPPIDPADPASVIAVLGILKIDVSAAWAEVQPCVSEAGKTAVATSVRASETDGLLVRHIAALKQDETPEEGVARVAALLAGAGLADVRKVREGVANLQEVFESAEALEEISAKSTKSVVIH